MLDFPIDYITKKKIGSKFRETDIRWSPEEHKVTRILLKPNQTATYIIDNNPNVAYRKDQLQIIQPNEIMPNKKAIRPLTKKKLLRLKRKHLLNFLTMTSWTRLTNH